MDSSNSERRGSTYSSNHSVVSSAPSIRNVPARPRALSENFRQPSIRLVRAPSRDLLTRPSNIARRPVPSSNPSRDVPAQPNTIARRPVPSSNESESGRRRSASDPLRTHLNELGSGRDNGSRLRGVPSTLGHEPLPEIVEGAPMDNSHLEPPPDASAVPQAEPKKKLRKYRGRFFRKSSNGSLVSVPSNVAREEYESGLVDMLDLVDPEISTLNTLTNVQNSLFVPNLGRFVNRRPTYTLTRRDEQYEDSGTSTPEEEEFPKEQPSDGRPGITRGHTLDSISSKPDDSHYAVLPHGVALEGWSAEDRKELNDHVRHMLHSRRSKFKRSLKGFKQYISHPLGLFITVYATLITFFGLIWVLFLIGWIGLGSRKDYIINIIDNILVALFAIMGDGLAPFRAVDTYHMIFIAHYHHLTRKVRNIKSLPPLQNHNDLPTVRPEDIDMDIEAGRELEKQGTEEFSVLNAQQQKRLIHHQEKFAKSHTFYKPHETATHYAFPIRFLIAAVILLDMHSCLQISLGACTWGISYHDRPFALTTVILCCSITVNITAGIVIMFGDRRTRKKDVLELMHKQELTAEAMRKLEMRREKERKRNDELDLPMPPPLGTDTVGVEAVGDVNRTPRAFEADGEEKGEEKAGNGSLSPVVERPAVEKANPLERGGDRDGGVEPFPEL